MKTIYLKDHPKLVAAHEFVTSHPESIIAGGVARDVFLNREYKDVDIFMPEPLTRDASQSLHKLIRDMPSCEVHPCTYMEPGSRYIVGEIDICVLPRGRMLDLDSFLQSFDMVMSQAWLEPTADGFTVSVTKLFTEFNGRRLLGYYPSLANKSFEHVRRIQEKFDNYLAVALAEPKDGMLHDGAEYPL